MKVNSLGELNVGRLRQVLSYDAEMGLFRWAVGTHLAGKIAGCHHSDGYRRIKVDGRNWLAHRLAWYYVHGEDAPGLIDHINGEPADNRIANLRIADHRRNLQNRRGLKVKSRTGLMGVRLLRDGVYQARITTAAGRLLSLGLYRTPEEAGAAYLTAKRELHEGCTL